MPRAPFGTTDHGCATGLTCTIGATARHTMQDLVAVASRDRCGDSAECGTARRIARDDNGRASCVLMRPESAHWPRMRNRPDRLLGPQARGGKAPSCQLSSTARSVRFHRLQGIYLQLHHVVTSHMMPSAYARPKRWEPTQFSRGSPSPTVGSSTHTRSIWGGTPGRADVTVLARRSDATTSFSRS